MQEKEWDFFMVHFYGTDVVQHEFWHLCDQTHPQFSEAAFQQHGNVIKRHFQETDLALGQLLARVDPGTCILVMSDHGFGKITRFFNVNLWLHQLGLLKFKKDVLTRAKLSLFKLGFTYLNTSRALLRLNLTQKAMKAGHQGRQDFTRRFFLSFDDVDWPRTQAYAMGNYGQIFVNVKGREPQGVVDPADSDSLLLHIERQLRQVIDPTNGTPIVDQIWRREDVYTGKRIDLAPDLMFTTHDWLYKAMGWADFPSSRLLEPVVGTMGHHRIEGMFIAQRPGTIKQGITLPARIEDLAPTLLYLSGLPIPMDMDGQVLRECFEDSFVRKYTIQYDEPIHPERSEDLVYSEKEEAQVRQHLRDLGYV
jgi:predicted AlkP superfamily phosphohydrolase/phosphomutase